VGTSSLQRRETLEGVVPNDLLSLLDNGVQITHPDLNSTTDRIFVPRAALSEVTVLGVVGIARRKPAAAAAAASQPACSTNNPDRLYSLFALCETRTQSHNALRSAL